jgi:glycosyltransferase involved in cell wall biosynthesis
LATLSVVIPALNEERGIGPMLKRVMDAGERIVRELPEINRVEIVVVDDGSTDGTARVVASFANVRLIKHATNCGYGAALKTGFVEAEGEYPARARRSAR